MIVRVLAFCERESYDGNKVSFDRKYKQVVIKSFGVSDERAGYSRKWVKSHGQPVR